MMRNDMCTINFEQFYLLYFHYIFTLSHSFFLFIGFAPNEESLYCFAPKEEDKELSQ
jgi:hypothetical protein